MSYSLYATFKGKAFAKLHISNNSNVPVAVRAFMLAHIDAMQGVADDAIIDVQAHGHLGGGEHVIKIRALTLIL